MRALYLQPFSDHIHRINRRLRHHARQCATEDIMERLLIFWKYMIFLKAYISPFLSFREQTTTFTLAFLNAFAIPS